MQNKEVHLAGGAKGAVTVGKAILTTRTAPVGPNKGIYCAETRDNGKTWRDLGIIITDNNEIDLGDGCLLARQHGKKNELWYSCRHNNLKTNEFAIEVYQSLDGGKNWAKHSTVARSSGKMRGLWSSFLLEIQSKQTYNNQKQTGEVWCFYDDEDTPTRRWFPRHQWFVARRWDSVKNLWEEPITVSRAFDSKHLSRDGMGSVVQMPDGEMLCAIESVRTSPPHAANIRLVSSLDHGTTWSHTFRERTVIYEPKRTGFSAYCPWLTLLPNGELLCVFATNEDQPTPDAPGTPAHLLHGDIKMVRSNNRGRTWSDPVPVFQTTHRTYMPQLIPLSDKTALCLFLDFQENAFQSVLTPLK
jgi:hypothetical protein